jgi:hypothetical protein
MPIIKDYNQETIMPTNLILHDGETKLGFLDERDKSKVYMFDLEKGQVVQ